MQNLYISRVLRRTYLGFYSLLQHPENTFDMMFCQKLQLIPGMKIFSFIPQTRVKKKFLMVHNGEILFSMK